MSSWILEASSQKLLERHSLHTLNQAFCNTSHLGPRVFLEADLILSLSMGSTGWMLSAELVWRSCAEGVTNRKLTAPQIIWRARSPQIPLKQGRAEQPAQAARPRKRDCSPACIPQQLPRLPAAAARAELLQQQAAGELAGSQIGQIGSRRESLPASQEEAGILGVSGSLTEVNTNVMLQCLQKIRLSRMVCTFPTETGAAP